MIVVAGESVLKFQVKSDLKNNKYNKIWRAVVW